MPYRMSAILALSLLMPSVGCRETPAHTEQPAHSDSGEFRLHLESVDYRGGEHEQHWHLTTWKLENHSCESIDEAVVRVSLFDDEGQFLGHHSVTFQYLDAGSFQQQKRLLFLKSPTLSDWQSRFEAVHHRSRGEISQQLQLSAATESRRS